MTEKIGTGGMADVYKAVDETLGRSVAVKVMHAKYANDPTFTARFRQEAQAAANLTSPNIVNIYDWGQDGDTYYIVMEYVRGTDLKTLIQQKTYLSNEQVIEVGIQVAKALDVAHGYDIIHRDIKPHNIMVTPDGQVKVMDFGIARAGNSTMTQTGSVLGTAHYVSPEQAQGKPLTPASDLYSLGIVLYEAACGKLPFDGDTPVAVAMKQVNEQPVAPSKYNPGIAPGLEAVIGKALVKDPRTRYTSAKDMMAALKSISKNTSDATMVVPAVAAAGAGIGATRVMPAVESGFGDANHSEPTITPVPEEKNYWWAWVLGAIVLVLIGVGIYFAFNGGEDLAPVPNVQGKTVAEATILIEEAGFVVGSTTEEYSPDVEVGLVISTDPEGNTEAEVKTPINLVVSLGIEEVEVPYIVGETEASARALIEAAGLVASPDPGEFSADVPAGQIISQDPEAGTLLPKGSDLIYVPSKGIETGGIPNVVGKSRSAAESAIKDAGFKVSVSEEYSSSVSKGVVVSQSPESGLIVGSGSTVRIVVSKGPEPTPTAKVPNVIGREYDEAISRLENAGFEVNVLFEMSEGTEKVIEQSPVSGTTADIGSTVTIVIDGEE